MSRYVAFLRGVNVGGNSTVKMDKLREMFESLGFRNVRTILNSGNVLFETQDKNPSILTKRLDETLRKTFGFEIPVMLRTDIQVLSLVNSRPFKNVKITPDTRLYVTFLSEAHKLKIKIPYVSPEKDFKILQAKDGAVCSSLILSPRMSTVDLMGFVEKEFGDKITTRNWNTIKKIGNAFE